MALHGGNELREGDLTIAISVGVVESLMERLEHLLLPFLGLLFNISLVHGQLLILLLLDLLFDDFVELFHLDNTITVKVELVHDIIGGLMSWRIDRVFLLLWASVTMILAELWALWLWPVEVGRVIFVLTVIVRGGVEVSFSAVWVAFFERFTSIGLGSDCVGSKDEGCGGKIFHLDLFLFSFKFEYI